jgi:hypothetical protein
MDVLYDPPSPKKVIKIVHSIIIRADFVSGYLHCILQSIKRL